MYDYDVKSPNLPFYGGREYTTTNFPSFFCDLNKILLKEFNSRKSRLHLTFRAGPNWRDKVWKNANSFSFFFFYRRFHCRRRRYPCRRCPCCPCQAGRRGPGFQSGVDKSGSDHGLDHRTGSPNRIRDGITKKSTRTHKKRKEKNMRE